MTWYELIRNVTELINRHTIAGETVSPAYDNQSDILKRVPNLVNAALTQIALTVNPVGRPDPERVPADPSDIYELSAPYAWLQAACYYAAAYLVADRNEFLYAALMNEYEAFLTRLSGRLKAEYTPVRDAYAIYP